MGIHGERRLLLRPVAGGIADEYQELGCEVWGEGVSHAHVGHIAPGGGGPRHAESRSLAMCLCVTHGGRMARWEISFHSFCMK